MNSAQNENKYYVYGFYISGHDEPFYIGKGSGNRYKTISKKYDRSQAFLDIIQNNDCYSKILFDNLSNNAALDKEKELINSLPNLVNKNDRLVSINNKKHCKYCNQTKDITDFYIGRSARCKKCYYENNKKYSIKKTVNDPEKQKKYYEENADRLKLKMKEYQNNNKEKLQEYRKKYYQKKRDENQHF